MQDGDLPATLAARIEDEYRAAGHRLGWRLLYSPPHVLAGAEVAFIGLNPGGSEPRPEHDGFAMSCGSAYATECWGKPPGASVLQRQVLALFERLDVSPEDVLAGNLVPFRSPSWDELGQRPRALAFGKAIWTEILGRAGPRIVVGMGNDVVRALAALLDVRDLVRLPVGWGRVTGARGTFAGGVLVGLPHLSRFAIVTRDESQPSLRRLLDL